MLAVEELLDVVVDCDDRLEVFSELTLIMGVVIMLATLLRERFGLII
jgi:hypothetical protein